MDKASVTRPAPPSTRSVLAGAHLCDQVAGLLLVESKTIRQVFPGGAAAILEQIGRLRRYDWARIPGSAMRHIPLAAWSRRA